MRHQDQWHDAKGRFASDPIPETDGTVDPTWAQVTATFLEPEEKNELANMDGMAKAETVEEVDSYFAASVQGLVEYRGSIIRRLTAKHIAQQGG